jgi:hypothetical protein
VHFRAQFGRNCTLFASESAKKGVFCRGEGRLFGRPKTGVFGVSRVSRGARRARAKWSPVSIALDGLFYKTENFYFRLRN